MQVFEFHFNPKLKEDLIFDSFCYEPENIYERRLGSLYMIGELKNALPQNLRLLDNLALTIKREYYSKFQRTSEEGLKEGLKRANDFLANEVSKENVSWLGNLSFAAISLTPHQKPWSQVGLNFSKVGDLKILLARTGQIIDIGKNLEFEEIEPYPLKIFGNIVSGKLAENDLVLVLTKEVFSAFSQGGLLSEIARIPHHNFGGELKKILKNREKELLKISGICFSIFLSKEVAPRKKEIIHIKFRVKEFSLRETFSPFIETFKKIIQKPLLRLDLKAKFLKWVVGGWRPQIKFPKLRAVGGWRPKIKVPKLRIKPPTLSKNLVLTLILILFLAFGFFIFQKEKEKQLKEHQTTLNQIQERITQAESLLIISDLNPQAAEKANSILKEAWEEILPLAKIASSLPPEFRNRILTLRDGISKNLYQLNKLIEIQEPEILFEFDPKEFISQKMIVFNKEIYFFSPYSKNLFKLTGLGQAELLQIDKKFNLAAELLDSILFFSKPNQLVVFKNGQFSETFSLKEPYLDFNFDDFSTYKSNLYFFDRKSGEIIKYPYLEDFKWGSPQIWLNPAAKKVIFAKSMAVDGSIWILNEDNSIDRYYAGNLQETLVLDFFPYPKDFSKIFASASLPYLYLLEPAQKRIVILNKRGEIVKQFQSEKFDNLLDFSVSKNRKTIYLLNGLKVFKIEF